MHSQMPVSYITTPQNSFKDDKLIFWSQNNWAGTLHITWQHGSDGKNLIRTVMITAGDHHLGKLRVEGELCHHGPQLCEITIVVKCTQVIQQLKSSHQCLWCWNKMISEIESSLQTAVNLSYYEGGIMTALWNNNEQGEREIKIFLPSCEPRYKS